MNPIYIVVGNLDYESNTILFVTFDLKEVRIFKQELTGHQFDSIDIQEMELNKAYPTGPNITY